MIIDSHTHILPDEFRRDKDRFLERDLTFRELFSSAKAASASGDDLLSAMSESGVDKSVACGYGWTDIETARVANDYILETARRSEGRIVPFCSVNPLWGRDALDEVARCADEGARGVGELHPDTQGLLNADLATLAPFMDALRARQLPVLVHASDPVGHAYPGKGSLTPEFALAFAETFRSNVIIFAHLGGGLPFYSLMPEVRRSLENVWFDTAASSYLYRSDVFGVAAAAAGAGRILFGSDFPLVPQTRPLAEVRRSGLDRATEAAMLGETAARLLGV